MSYQPYDYTTVLLFCQVQIAKNMQRGGYDNSVYRIDIFYAFVCNNVNATLINFYNSIKLGSRAKCRVCRGCTARNGCGKRVSF